MKRNLLYNILLACFAALMVVVLIFKGPPSTAVSRPIPTPVYALFGIDDPSQIDWYGIRTAEQDVVWERTTDGWQTQTGETVDTQLAETGTYLLASLQLRQLREFGPTESLAQYGVTTTPQFVVSFGLTAYNGKETFTLYLGTLTPDQSEFYAVFVDDNDPPRRIGEWVYLIPAAYIQTLAEIMVETTP
ncbi:MAG: hypothetical protein H6673_13915 [Anaerolineales bacterium]|nr:hypothetical protein [Anaerolineales bacterium]